MTSKEKIIENFKKVKALGLVKSKRKNNTGIGKTFEDYIGVVENNLEEPDLFGYEIKSHREISQSYVTLFTKVPDHPKGVNQMLKEKYGTYDSESNGIKILHTSFFADKPNKYDGRLSFQLINNRREQKIYIQIKDLNTGLILDSKTYYTYEKIEKALQKKLHNLFFVTAKKEIKDNCEYFYFDKAEIYSKPSLENFLRLLDEGKIMYDFRMGCYKSGKKKGKPHDHGSGFRIKEVDIKDLYDLHEPVE